MAKSHSYGGTSKHNLTSLCIMLIASQGLILPGETVIITLQILVTQQCAMDLNLGREKLEELVILHTERGQDHFLSVSGTYGMNLKQLYYLTRSYLKADFTKSAFSFFCKKHEHA